VADDAADNCTADCSDRAAARKDRSTDGTGTGTDGSVPVLRRHAGTTDQTEHHCCRYCTDCEASYRFHGITSVKK